MNEENSIPNIWKAQENMIRFYKLLSIGLGVVVVLLLVFVMVAFFRDPIVILKGATTQEYYPSSRAKAELQKSDVEAFSKRFLTALYVWSGFSGEKLAKEIAPLAESPLVAKIVDAQTQKYGRQFKDKKLSQAITFVSVEVTDDRVVCRFDRVLKIEGVPLVIPTEVTLAMLQGSQTDLNPMGIYVSGIAEREGEK
jgi:hypothetical protein